MLCYITASARATQVLGDLVRNHICGRSFTTCFYLQENYGSHDERPWDIPIELDAIDAMHQRGPLNTSGPIGNAWGLWDIGDQLGMLNRLNESTTVAALQEVQHGIRVCTDWTLDNPLVPPFGRKPFEHDFVTKFFQTGRSSIDDTININTQSSSKWDGFRHFGYQGTAQYFNGVTNQQILNGTDNILGLHHWVNSGGIVGRGVLLDYAEYMAAHGIVYDVFNNTEILASDLDAVLAFQNTTTRPGDILFVRSNLTTRFKELSQEAQNAYSGANPLPGMGVKSEEATLRWIWDREPAAVASDMISFEITPMVATPFLLDEWLLAGWGMPIGELFDLQKLGDTAKQLNKYNLFFSSVPLNVPGGVASPPNGVGIF
ncbi:hypothetical protein INS49_012516 [Diaporthe citri]|uniref:uncharacterized protein n=1 Tax=Diaporthe citri TaxID=83186 RepID=UPI001C7E5500|nr:uncharacterized protein INS49_012516 [Diaporthe citri]KAG6358996.1 hypothetical protein INS49_012516 [Diaporthe citri]